MGRSEDLLPEPTHIHEPVFVLANGRYAVLEPLGEGGTATVHRCQDRDLGVERAIKLRRVREDDIDTSMVQRLADEARVMARLDHPHILPVFDVGVDQGWQYVVMELASGSLSDRTKREGAYSPQQAVDMLLDLLGALTVAHRAGVVHRDIKPHNVLIAKADGKVLLADWGIALLGDRDQTLTRTGMAMGSVSYMAPEQRLDAHDVGPPADVYAAGAMLYNLITCASPVDLFTAQARSPRWEGVPPELVPVLRRACAYEVADRYPTTHEFADALAAVRDEMPDLPMATTGDPDREAQGTLAASATRSSAAEPSAEAARSNPWVTPVGLGLLAISTTTLAAAMGWWAFQDPVVPVRVTADAPAQSAVAPPASDPAATATTQRIETAAETPTQPPSAAPAAGIAAPAERGQSAASATPPPERANPEPAETAPPAAVALLPIHGPWRGSVEGAVARLRLDGPTGALRGTVSMNGVDGRTTAPASGTFDAPSGRLELQVGTGDGSRDTWTCIMDGDRLRGSISRAATGELLQVSLKRQAP